LKNLEIWLFGVKERSYRKHLLHAKKVLVELRVEKGQSPVVKFLTVDLFHVETWEKCEPRHRLGRARARIPPNKWCAGVKPQDAPIFTPPLVMKIKGAPRGP
jgi:hypothetical protein